MGGLGSFGLNAYAPEEILEVNKKIKQLTRQPYALNLWVPLKNDPITNFKKKDFEELKQLFRPHFEKMGGPMPEMPNIKSQDFESQIEAVLKVKPPVASFIFGIPSKEIIRELKKRGITTIGTATTSDEALTIQESEIDLVVASGAEAGGHRASFLQAAEDSLTTTHDLVRQITNKMVVPLIAAGGISNGKDVAEILKLGASAAQIGTAFLATDESNASAQHRTMLLSEKPLKTDLTKMYTGRLARTLSNKIHKEFEKPKDKYLAPYPIQGAFISALRQASMDQKKLDFISFWSGQPSSPLVHTSAKKLFES
ncbi:NAD(P)H-dependent flavin oxidoreductase, partial [Xanthovirga aplysinae]|uniref:NAD(P)H-dependent flavin oxidoreductase n=1 Tax=Xanthovirga aplysinae TaxID=2529853 RepID=UPI001FE81263